MTTEFTPLAAALGGAMIGLSAAALLLVGGRIAGITRFIRRMLPGQERARPLEALGFVAGLVAAPALRTSMAGAHVAQPSVPAIPSS